MLRDASPRHSDTMYVNVQIRMRMTTDGTRQEVLAVFTSIELRIDKRV